MEPVLTLLLALLVLLVQVGLVLGGLFGIVALAVVPSTPPGTLRTMLGSLWAGLSRRTEFAAPAPANPTLARSRMVDLLMPYRYPGEQPSALRERHLHSLMLDAFRLGVPYTYMWRWGRVYGPDVLVAALEVGLTRDEWLGPFLRDKHARTSPDLDGIRFLAAFSDRSQLRRA